MVLIVGAFISYVNFKKRMRQANATPKTKRRVFWALISAALIGVLSANIINWVTFPELWGYSITERFTLGGFSFYHGMLAFLGMSLLMLRLFKQNHRYWVNEIVPSIILFNIIARIGCSLAGCCYGVHLHEFSIFGLTIDIFPVRLLEIVCMIILFFVFRKKVIQNRLFWYLACYSIIRFILEFLRGDDRGGLLLNWLTPAQITSVLIWIGLGVYILIRFLKKLPLFKPIESYVPNPIEFQQPIKSMV